MNAAAAAHVLLGGQSITATCTLTGSELNVRVWQHKPLSDIALLCVQGLSIGYVTGENMLAAILDEGCIPDSFEVVL